MEKTQNLVWKRAWASFLDQVIILFYSLLMISPLLNQMQTQVDPQSFQSLSEFYEQSFANTRFSVVLFLIWGVGVIFYEPYCTYRYGWTLGKKILKISVTNDQGSQLTFMHSLARFLVKNVCIMIPYVGLICLIFSFFRLREGKKALWDLWAKTQVISSTPTVSSGESATNAKY